MKMLLVRPLVFVIALFAQPNSIADEKPWPTDGWEKATPASQDVDAAPLDQLDREFASGEHGYVDGVMVFRNGYLVYERNYENDYDKAAEGKVETRGQYHYYDANWHPWYDRGPLHTIQSISKSVTSALVGIAIRRGEIPGVDVPIMPYFEDYDPAIPDARRDAITLSDLLTMTAGIDWDESSTDYTDPLNSAAALESSEDWVRYVLDLPMRAAPGEEYEYNSGITVLISHILWQATGKHADEYAMEHLFGPLGIDSYYWKKTPTGLVDTEGGLYLTPGDLAKIGYLYANDGKWDGERILPDGWVAASVSPDTEVPGFYARYGYQWWLVPYDGGEDEWAYAGFGYGGQRLVVVPEYDLIVVFTGWNIYDKPSIDAKAALERVLSALR